MLGIQSSDIKPAQRDLDTVEKLVQIWESAVRPTHTFLSEEDIASLKPEVEAGLKEIPELYCYFENEEPLGFIGIDGDKIEMLFVDDSARGKGVGKKLVEYAIQNFSVTLVDVNEQNEQAEGFYDHLGFKAIDRSAQDEQGRPFPILHLSLV